jgi:hypothetical protein
MQNSRAMTATRCKDKRCLMQLMASDGEYACVREEDILTADK